MIDPQMELESIERAHLAATVVQDGFKVIHKIMLAEVEKFRLKLLNSDPVKRDEVLAAHTMAKAAAQVVAGIVNRINEEVMQYTNTPRVNDPPQDSSEGLSLDDIAKQVQDLPNFLGGGLNE
jgi:hypothetical protein